MKYHICKATRLYNGAPYCGPSSNNNKAEFNTLEEALAAQEILQEKNPVGWNIWFDNQLVHGQNHFKDNQSE